MVDESWLALMAFLVLAAIAFVGVLELYGPGGRTVVQKLWCSLKTRSVVVRFRTSPFSTAHKDVEACSAFPNGGRPTCDKQCLRRPPER